MALPACTELASQDERGLEPIPSGNDPGSRGDDRTADGVTDDLSGASTPLGDASVTADDAGALLDPVGSGATSDAGLVDADTSEGAEDAGVNGLCAGGLAFGRSCYVPAQVALTWDAARAECLASGADLVSVESVAEEAFVASLLAESIWLGGNDRALDGFFVWPSGAPLVFSNWAPNQPDAFPDQDCIEKRQEPGEPWYDSVCSNVELYVCERPLAQ